MTQVSAPAQHEGQTSSAALFFALGLHLAAFIDLILLFIMLRHALLQFYMLRRSAAHWLFPTLLWTTFAGYLNLGIWLLNR